MRGDLSGLTAKWADLDEPSRVLALVKELHCCTLGHWDGCCCSRFSIRNVNVEIACGKGGAQGVWVSSKTLDYDDAGLRPIMEEVVRQCDASAGRCDPFVGHLHERRLSILVTSQAMIDEALK